MQGTVPLHFPGFYAVAAYAAKGTERVKIMREEKIFQNKLLLILAKGTGLEKNDENNEEGQNDKFLEKNNFYHNIKKN